ncbi:uncharacterized protein cd8b [Halichoeres trimaculatus]|uniref:uncharacterized protein cd8b n=1 Tax=Halichoeres trimaculatus TaxID=147232 RepID=UPI003D9F053E
MRENASIRYPQIHSTEVIDCGCTNIICATVYWFRSDPNHGNMQFIGQCNNANREQYGPGVDSQKYKMSRKSDMSFTLRISDVTAEDRGVYSCVLKDQKKNELWRPGFLLLPGVIPPTEPPKTKPKSPVNSGCDCSTEISPQDGCGSLILWPLVGIIATLGLLLICILYYFSRLPKKCQHHFVKKR